MQTREQAGIIGLDISAYQTITDAPLLWSRTPYIYLRAFGSNHAAVDTTFYARAADARANNVPVGAYYFATPTTAIETDPSECDAQAAQFVAVLQTAFGANDYGDLVPMLDVEAWGATTPQGPMYYLNGTQVLAWVKRFRDQFFAATGRRLGFYSNRYFLTDPTQLNWTTQQITELQAMPLWLAEYDTYYPQNMEPTGAPADLGGWSTFSLWQYAEAVEADAWGLSHFENKVDVNRTDSIDRIRPPRPVKSLTLSDQGDGALLVTIEKPDDVDYIGAAVYLNGTYKAWITKTVSETTLVNVPTGIEHEITVYSEDVYNDVTPYSKTIILAAAPGDPENPPGGDKMQRGISTETANRFLINEGVIYINYGEVGERLLGATRGGTEFVVEQEIHDPEIDGKKGPIKGTRRVIESIAKLSCELLEITRENFMLTLAGADSTAVAPVVGPPAVEGYDSIRRTRELTVADYFTNIAVVGELSDGSEVVILLYNALNDEGVTLGQEDRNEATLPVSFTAHYDPAELSAEPWEIRFLSTP